MLLDKKSFMYMLGHQNRVVKNFFKGGAYEALKRITKDDNIIYEGMKQNIDKYHKEKSDIIINKTFLTIDGSRVYYNDVQEVVFATKKDINIYVALFKNGSVCMYVCD